VQNIFSHIAYLLTKHECVIIPGFGALVHSSAPARNAADEDIFSPPSVSLEFNSELKHNDGILADSVKREQKISYNDANKMVSDFSIQLTEQLKNKKEITIPQVGRFVLSEDKKINFSPAADLSANADQFGFKNFYIPLLSEIVMPVEKEKSEKAKDKPVVIIPFGKRLLNIAAVAAIALIFMLLSTLSIDNRDIPVQYAGIFSPYTPVTIRQTVSDDVVVEDTTGLVAPEEDMTQTVVSVPEKGNVPEPQLVEKKENPVLAVENSSDGYLIIIASFSNRRDAERGLSEFKKQFDTASILEKSGRSRIYIHSFQDKKEAERFLDKFRLENPKHKDAWLLSNRERG